MHGAVISDEDLANLPEDRDLAFLQLEATLRVRLQNSAPHESGSAAAASYSEYINGVLAIVEALELNILVNWKPQSITNSIFDAFPQFYMEVNNEIGKIKIRSLRRTQSYSVVLEPAGKEQIRHYIGRIKDIVDRLDVSDAKREALYSKINALTAEVDRDRTRFEAISALLIEAASTTGEVARKLEPIRRWIGSIAGVVAHTIERKEGTQKLPRPTSPKQLPPPVRSRKRAGKRKSKKLTELADMSHEDADIPNSSLEFDDDDDNVAPDGSDGSGT